MMLSGLPKPLLAAMGLHVLWPILLHILQPDPAWLVRKQRALLQSIRKVLLAGSPPEPLEYTPDDIALSKAVFMMLNFSALSYVLEGRMAHAFAIISFSIAFRVFGSREREVHRLYGVVTHAYIATVLGFLATDLISFPSSAKRHAVKLAISQVLMTESIVEAFAGTIAATIIMSSSFPLGAFFTILVPLHIINVRGFLASPNFLHLIKRLNRVSFFALLVPTLTMVSSLNASTGSHVSNSTLRRTMFVVGLVHVGLFMGCFLLGALLDQAIMPSYCSIVRRGDALASATERWDAFISRFLLYPSTVLFGSALALAPATLFESLAIRITAAIAITSMAAAMALIHAGPRNWQDPRRIRLVCFLAHISTLAFLLSCGSACEAQTVVLTTTRLFMATEKRRFSHVQMTNALCGALSTFAMNADLLGIVTMFISITSVAIGIISCLSREGVTEIYRQKSDLHMYLSHTIRQKFSSVGSALENVLLVISELQATKDRSAKSKSRSLQPGKPRKDSKASGDGADAVYSMLYGALRECRRGHDMCTASNVTHSLLQQERLSEALCARQLSAVMNDWREGDTLRVQEIVVTGMSSDREPYLVLDWELLRLSLSTWITNAQILRVSRDGKEIRFIVEEGVSRPFNPVLAKALGCCVIGKEMFITALEAHSGVTGSVDLQSDASTGASPSQTPSSLIGTLEPEPTSEQHWSLIPMGLSFAVLDDNVLARKNVEHICSRFLHSSPNSFTRGKSRADCIFFPHEIRTRHCDIAIFDERLDYDDETGAHGSGTSLSGSVLATQAREQGFEGCIILHSAHALALGSKKPGAVFDGFIEKSASRSEFIAGVERAWIRANERRQHGSLSRVSLSSSGGLREPLAKHKTSY